MSGLTPRARWNRRQPRARASERGVSALSLILILVLAGSAVIGAAVYYTGFVSVRVEDRRPGGDRIRVVIPAAFVPLGMKLVPEEELKKASAEVRVWLPALKAAGEELKRFPEGTLVEIEDGTERVSVVKRGRRLVIDASSDWETIHLSLPVGLISAVARELEAPL